LLSFSLLLLVVRVTVATVVVSFSGLDFSVDDDFEDLDEEIAFEFCSDAATEVVCFTLGEEEASCDELILRVFGAVVAVAL
jgi:hypothetical protein